jgi:hypothetical protein
MMTNKQHNVLTIELYAYTVTEITAVGLTSMKGVDDD